MPKRYMEVIQLAITSASLPAKKRILTVCVRLFLEKGYKKTTVAEIVQKAKVSNSTFQNIFGAKDGVLTELVEFMFDNQFSAARKIIGTDLSGVYVFAVETAIQLTLTELNENIREIYIEAYAQKDAEKYILDHTAQMNYQLFGKYQPKLNELDFRDLEIGTASIMRSYMSYRCDENMTLAKKISYYLTLCMRIYKVPEDEQRAALKYVENIDVRTLAEQVVYELFNALAMHYEFSLEDKGNYNN